MKKEVLIGIIVVLVFALVLQAAYITGLKRKGNSNRMMLGQRSRAPIACQRSAESNYPIVRAQVVDPFEEMERMQRRMNKMFEDNENTIVSKIEINEPSLDFSEVDNAYIITVDMPGMEKKDINIEVRDNYIVISGERKSVENIQKKNFYLKEISAGKFSRALGLPRDAVKNQISSEYANGVLTVKIPKDLSLKQAGQSRIKVPVR